MAQPAGCVAMSDVWIISDSIISPLGNSSVENYDAVRKGQSGIKFHETSTLSKTPIHASLITTEANLPFTRFESIAVDAVANAIDGLVLPRDKTIFILSTTKGNIELIDSNPKHARIGLNESAKFIATHFGFTHTQVVSNACISGSLALLVAQRMLAAQQFDHAVVVAAEVLSKFIVSGFQSLHALSPDACRPFDHARTGISLGEAAAAVVLSTTKGKRNLRLAGGGLSNDANHISGPSRTGKELSVAIDHALNSSKVSTTEIDFISAHGTATIFNDEMEAKAFSHSNIQHAPLHSLKGYFGHTLGAAGVVESIIAMHALEQNELIPSMGFESSGVSVPVNVVKKLERRTLNRVLKTASGFGGCNAAIILEKI
ncbi:beta-ketoacyl-[acyl-carrier-protein] synthase family protein [Pseudochryseolinea flava]|uniref:Beta-ketoacyl synthase n=1 Tax=Pseudochryseolinea flava TaxID=2059302 RepID=A0A364Y041_9BACT|nr:beta-ketoacyl synthase N-terminal-like domain-containing protein [Pseudochryseolinea flava]RAW00144.1 beta-ketoacyl synthase [Pseudochryseolinea flava]